MDCTNYDEMMSLHLDGLLGPEDERLLLAHVKACKHCEPIWSALWTAHTLLIESASEPVALPGDFTVKVMNRVAAVAVTRPDFEMAAAVGQPAPVLPSILPPQFGGPDNPFYLPELSLHDWQARVATYVRGVATVALSVAATVGILLALLVSGSLQPDASLAPIVDTLRTFFGSLDTWASSLMGGIGTQALVIGGTIMGLMALAGWQIVANYHSAAEMDFESTAGEAAA